MSDFIGTIATAEAIILSIAFCGTLLFAYGYFKRNLFGVIKMFIGGALVALLLAFNVWGAGLAFIIYTIIYLLRSKVKFTI